ncbi:MAG: hypothetical protein ACPG49_08210 [Chitinophagales bacterium]
MKKWILFLLIFVGTPSFAQSIALWEKQIDSVDDISAIVTLSENRFILLGTKVKEDKNHLYLANFDIEGTLLWDSLYTHIEGFGGDLMLTPKGTLAIVSGTNTGGLFLEITISGEILNTQIHEAIFWINPKIIGGIGGGFIVNSERKIVHKLDDSGSIDWFLAHEDVPGNVYTDIIVGEDGRYHGIGSSGIVFSLVEWNILFSHIDTQGTSETIDTLKGGGNSFSSYQDAYAMMQAKNGDFIIVGRDGHWGYGPMFLRVNEVGNILPSSNSIYAEELYDALLIDPLNPAYFFISRDYRALEVYENPNGVFTLLGEAITDYEANTGVWVQYKKPFILQVDESGELLCFHTFLDETVEEFEISTDNQYVISGAMYSCSSQLADGSIVMAAKTHTSNGDSEMHLFRFDVENLCADIEATDIEVENKNQSFIQITPNPVREEATIHYQIPKDGVLKMYDCQGGLIESWELKRGDLSLTLEVNNWLSGVYFYGLEIEGKKLEGGKLLVENQ